uniref:Uncharacterized protein n=1 Tax=Plectus sambesii TaxID=2011161 RepID=A0A914XK49_9BILA
MFDGHPNLHRRHGLLSPYVLKLLFGVFLMFTVVYFYSDRSQNMQLLQLKSNEADTCAQKSDSLSAQLQVMYEHKSRLEKLLAEKQMSSARTIHDLEKQLKAASEKADSESNSALDCQSKVSSLQSQLNSLKEEKLHDDGQVQEELTKAKDDLSNAHRKLADLEKAKNTASEDVNTLSAQVKQLQAEVEQCASNDHNIEANAAVKRDERSNVLDNQSAPVQPHASAIGLKKQASPHGSFVKPA